MFLITMVFHLGKFYVALTEDAEESFIRTEATRLKISCILPSRPFSIFTFELGGFLLQHAGICSSVSCMFR